MPAVPLAGDAVTRDEVVKGLENVLSSKNPQHFHADALRAAIALLTPPTTAEIEAARTWADGITVEQQPGMAVVTTPHLSATIIPVLRRALDALARESELQELVRVTCPPADENTVLRALKVGMKLRIVALEARVAELEGMLEVVDKETGAI
jgi:hypothetical protein